MELTKEEMSAISAENAANGWGYDKKAVMDFIERHRKGDEHEKAAIDYRFEDVNYHEICRCLDKGDYDGAIAHVNKFWK